MASSLFGVFEVTELCASCESSAMFGADDLHRGDVGAERPAGEAAGKPLGSHGATDPILVTLGNDGWFSMGFPMVFP